MALKQRFRKGTKGYNGEAFVIPAVAVPTAATYQAFIEATGPAGQVGIFNADTNALITTALAEGQHFFVAQRRNTFESAAVNGVHKSSPFVYSKKGVKAVDYVAPVKDAYTITLPGYTPEAGKEITVKVIETADESFLPPTFSVTHKVKSGDTLTTIYAALAEKFNSYSPAVGVGDDMFVTATSSASGLVLTHKYDQAAFRVALPGYSYEIGGTIAHSTPAVFGSGFFDEVAQLEYEAQVFDGVTTQYPGGNFVPTDFGTTQLFAVEGTQYAKLQLNSYKNEYSPTPVNQHHHLKHLTLIPVQGGASYTQLNIIFGITTA